MSRAIFWNFSLAVPFLALLTGCALFEERAGPSMMYGPREQVYFATYEETWKAANFALQPYPIRISTMDQGHLETEPIRGYRIFTPPYKSETAVTAESYRLLVRVIKGAINGRPATKVTIVKDLQMQTDFFSDPRSLPSDGLEEKTLLYRISREIQIERAIARAQSAPAKKSR